MYPDNHPIFYNDSQILRVNCKDKEVQGLSLVNDIVQKIQDYPCNSTSWHGGLTYFINNCHFTFDEFKPIIDSIADRFLECKDYILNVLHNKPNYLSYLDFTNNKKLANVSLGVNGIEYAVEKIHNVLQKFYDNSPNITKIFINLTNNGVMRNETKKLLENCTSMVVHYTNVPTDFVDRDSFNVIAHDIKDNYFDIRGNSSGVYGIECSFNQAGNNEALASSLVTSDENINILPLLGVGIFVAIGAGATYLYNQYNIVNSGGFGARSDGATPICNRQATSDDVTNFSSIDYSYNQNVIEDIDCIGEDTEIQEILI